MTRTTTKRTTRSGKRSMTKRTIGNLNGRPGLERKAARLEVAIQAAIQNGRLGWLCGVLVDKGENATGSRLPLANLTMIERRLGIDWNGHPGRDTVSF